MRYAITFGEVAISHVGGQELVCPPSLAERAGFTVEELQALHTKYPETQLYRLSDRLPAEFRTSAEEATVLVFPAKLFFREVEKISGVPFPVSELHREQLRIPYDRKFWNARRKVTQNKQARYNVVFGPQTRVRSVDYQQPTVVGFQEVPWLAVVREWLPAILGEKARGLNAEGNHYYEERSGIGFHGDSERRIVICLSLGDSTTLRYHWRLPGSSSHTLPPIDIRVHNGDIYVMSEKATGYDWRYSSKVRVVHAAGSAKYINS